MSIAFAAESPAQLSAGRGERPAAAIVILCRESGAREILQRELSKRYGMDYRITACGQAGDLTALILDYQQAGLPVALVIGAVDPQDLAGIGAFAAVRRLEPAALRLAVFSWGDWESARAVFDAVTLGTVDRWLTHPVQALDEEFHRAITESLGLEQPAGWCLRGGADHRRTLVGAIAGAARPAGTPPGPGRLL
jgi:hypothetical protein